MFAKIFSQIYDSSIVEKPETRFTFMDFLVLADRNGVVDMTHEAIARRTNRPIELIRETIAELESPDLRSRTPEFSGARIKRLDDHRDWGWFIVNYQLFREIASEEQRREKTLARVHKLRGKKKLENCNAPVTHVNDSPSISPSQFASVQKEEFEEKTKARPADAAEAIAYCVEIGLPATDGQWLWDKWEGNGFTNNGKKMKSWQATARTWKGIGTIFPSMKAASRQFNRDGKPPPESRAAREFREFQERKAKQ